MPASNTISIRFQADGAGQVVSDMERIATTGTRSMTEFAAATNKTITPLEALSRQSTAASRAVDQVRASIEATVRAAGVSNGSLGFGPSDQDVSRVVDRYARIATAARQAEQAAQAQRAFNAILGIGGSNDNSARQSAQVFLEAAQAEELMASKAAALRAQIDPLGAAQSKMNAEIASATDLLKAGAITEAEHIAAVALSRQRYAEAEQALTKLSGAHEMASGQMMALTAAARHMFDAVASGRPPLQALTMEAGNLSYALSGGGLMGAIESAGAAILAFINPVTVGITAVVALTAGVALAWHNFAAGQKELEQSLNGVGRASGATVSQLEQIAEASASAAHITIGSARDMEAAFVKTGNVGLGQLPGLIELTKRYADATGQDLDKAIKAIAKDLEDPAKGFDALNAVIGASDAKTREHIITLAASGDKQQAVAEIVKAMLPVLKQATDNTGWLGKAWDYVAQKASEAATAIGKAASGPDLAQRVADVRKQIADLEANEHSFSAPVDAPTEIADLKAYLATLEKKLTDQQTKARAQAAAENARRLSLDADEATRTGMPGVADLQALIAERTRVGAAVNDPTGQSQRDLGDLLQRNKTYYEELGHAIDTYLDPATKAQKLQELEIQALNAKTPAEKAAIAAERERISLAGEKVTPAAAANQIRLASALASATAAQNDNNQSIKDAEQIYAALTKKIDPTADATATYFKQVDALNELLDAGRINQDQYAEAVDLAGKAAFDAADKINAQGDALKAQVEHLQAHNAAILSGTDALSRLDAAQQADIDAKSLEKQLLDAIHNGYTGLAEKDVPALVEQYKNLKANEPELSHLAQVIEQTRTPMEKYEEALKRIAADRTWVGQHKDLVDYQTAMKALDRQTRDLNPAFQELKDFGTRAFDQITQSLTDFAVNGGNALKSLAGVAHAVVTQIAAEFLKLAIANPIQNALFNVGAPTLDDVGGLLGGASSGGLGGTASLASNAFSFGRLLSGFSFSPSGTLAGIGVSLADHLGIANGSLLSQAFGNGFGYSPYGIIGSLLGNVLGLGGGLPSTILSGIGSIAGGALAGGSSAAIGLLGAAAGPIGAIAGGLLGTVLGGLFGSSKPPRWHLEVDTAAQSQQNLLDALYQQQGPFGYATANTKHVPYSAVQQIVSAVSKADTSVAADLSDSDIALVSAALQAADPYRSKQRASIKGDTFQVFKDRFTTELKALNIPTDTISGAFGGIKADDNNVDQLLSATTSILQTRKGYQDTISSYLNPQDTSAAAQSLKQIDDTFKSMRDNAEKLGISLQDVNQAQSVAISKLNEGFLSGISDQIDALDNPNHARDAEVKALNAQSSNLIQQAKDLGLYTDDVSAQIYRIHQAGLDQIMERYAQAAQQAADAAAQAAEAQAQAAQKIQEQRDTLLGTIQMRLAQATDPQIYDEMQVNAGTNDLIQQAKDLGIYTDDVAAQIYRIGQTGLDEVMKKYADAADQAAASTANLTGQLADTFGKAADYFTSILDPLNQLGLDLSFGGSSVLSPGAQVGAVSAEYARVRALAFSGDETALKAFPGLAQSYIATQRSYDPGAALNAVYGQISADRVALVGRLQSMEDKFLADNGYNLTAIQQRNTTNSFLAGIQQELTSIKHQLAQQNTSPRSA